MARRARSADAIGGGGAAASHASHADLLYTFCAVRPGVWFFRSSPSTPRLGATWRRTRRIMDAVTTVAARAREGVADAFERVRASDGERATRDVIDAWDSRETVD